MRSMAIDRISLSRRGLLTGALAGALTGALALPFAAQAAQATAALLTCGSDAGGDALFGLDAEGTPLWRHAIPGRGHGMGVSPDGRFAILSARRPDRWLMRLDLQSGATALWPSTDIAYGGHAIFLDPARIAATASDADGNGCIVVLDAANGKRIALWPSEGVDPHELLLLDGKLVVANGGDVLDKSNLVLMDIADGEVLNRQEAPDDLRRLSLRHMAVLDGKRVAVAAQDRGNADPAIPLLVYWQGGDLDWQPLGQAQGEMRGYCGSVAANGGGLYVTSPHGGLALHHPDGGSLYLPDICGAAPLKNGFFFTGGRGDLILPDGRRRNLPIAWDNHIRAIGA